jgi:hypothetical protein
VDEKPWNFRQPLIVLSPRDHVLYDPHNINPFIPSLLIRKERDMIELLIVLIFIAGVGCALCMLTGKMWK